MDTLTPSERSARMRLVKSKDTKPERELRRIVWGLGHRYRKNRRVSPVGWLWGQPVPDGGWHRPTPRATDRCLEGSVRLETPTPYPSAHGTS